MKNLLLILSAVILSSCASVSTEPVDNTLSKNEIKEGWELLFEGQDMSKWRNFKKPDINPKWKIIDGAMTLTARGGGNLITKAEYGDFDLRLEWKIAEKGSSGIFFHADEKGKQVYSHAAEIQILDNVGAKDNKKDNHRSGSLYDMIAASPESQKLAGEWNSIRIVHNGGDLKVWQNEVKTVDIFIGSAEWNKLVANSKFKSWEGFAKNTKGYIGLQDHGNVVSFKNLKIRNL